VEHVYTDGIWRHMHVYMYTDRRDGIWRHDRRQCVWPAVTERVKSPPYLECFHCVTRGFPHM
jgi:hypothetical protein